MEAKVNKVVLVSGTGDMGDLGQVNVRQGMYRTLHCTSEAYKKNNQGLTILPDILKEITPPFRVTSGGEARPRLAEWGCGNGRLVDLLTLWCDCTGIDITPSPVHQDLPNRDQWKFRECDFENAASRGRLMYQSAPGFDISVSFDVLEHLEPESIIPVLDMMHRMTKEQIILKIACSGSPPLHKTIKTPEEWMATLRDLYGKMGWSWRLRAVYMKDNNDGKGPVKSALLYGRYLDYAGRTSL